MEEFALESHERAFRAIDEGRFDNEIVPFGDVTTDEGPRRSSLEKMASLQPLQEGGRLTAALASQISDGATAMLVASEQAVKDHGLKPRARVHHMSVRADDPIYMLTAPIPATRFALEKTGMKKEEIDLCEVAPGGAEDPSRPLSFRRPGAAAGHRPATLRLQRTSRPPG